MANPEVNPAAEAQDAAMVYAKAATIAASKCVKKSTRCKNLQPCSVLADKASVAAAAATEAAQNAKRDVDNAPRYAQEANQAFNKAFDYLRECRRIYKVHINTMVANRMTDDADHYASQAEFFANKTEEKKPGSRFAEKAGAFAKKAREAAGNADLAAKKITKNSDVGEATANAKNAINQNEIAKQAMLDAYQQLESASMPLWKWIFTGYPERVIERFLPRLRKISWAFRLLPFLFANLRKISWKEE